MTDDHRPVLSADEIRAAFLAEAEEDTRQVISVSERLEVFRDLETKLKAAHAELVTAHDEAVKRPNVAAKLVELGLPDPRTLSVEIAGAQRAGRGRPKVARRGRAGARSSARPADDGNTAAAAGSTGDPSGI